MWSEGEGVLPHVPFSFHDLVKLDLSWRGWELGALPWQESLIVIRRFGLVFTGQGILEEVGSS